MTYAEDLVNKVEKAEAKIAESSSCGDTCSTCAVAPVANQEENDKVIAAKLRKVILDSIVSNVFEEKEFKELFYNVFERMAHSLS